MVRSTHGVNCTGSCSWKVYVKDGIITWEAQQTDYPSVGPEHSHLRDTGRAEYRYATDEQVMHAFQLLCRTEGIIPALESAHALATTLEVGRELGPDALILVNLSGRGDKDMHTAAQWFGLVDEGTQS